MTIAPDAHRKARSQRWPPAGKAPSWPIITEKRFRLPSIWQLEQSDTGRDPLRQCAVTGWLPATTNVEAGAHPKSP